MGFRAYMRMLRIHHTLFSLPFAYAGALMYGLSDPLDAIMIGVALFSARSIALLANDFFDRDIDALNPRTANRPLVTGEADPKVVLALMVLFSILFPLSALYFNWLAFLISFPIIFAELAYPFSKRIHCFPHFHLGAILGAVPLAAAIAVSNNVTDLPWGYAIAIGLWVAGFDMIYAMQDIEIDRRLGLKSFPSCFGPLVTHLTAIACHATTVILLIATAGVGPIGLSSIVIAALLLVVEHMMAFAGDYGRAFDVNLLVSLLLGLGIMIDLLGPP